MLRLKERFFKFGTPENQELANTIFTGVIKVIDADPRSLKDNESEALACLHKLMDDFIASFQDTGNLYSWDSPIEASLVRITR